MANNEPLIPPPSIGESAESKAVPKVRPQKRGKSSKLWLVILVCVVVGVGLGVFVYQQSVAPGPKPSTTPRPSIVAKPSPIPSPSIAPPEVSQVTPQGNTISFPKAGEIRVYFSNYEGTARVMLDMESTSGASSAQMVGNGSGTTMSYVDTGLVLPAAEQVKVSLFDQGDTTKPGYGWIPPKADNTCGGDGSTVHPNISAYISYVTGQADGEPLVSIQCWGDWGAQGDPSNADFNDYVVIWSYVPASAQVSPSPSASGTAASPSPSASATVSPSPSATVAASPSPSASTVAAATPTPSPSARVTMPEGSALPEAGIFEVTAGTMGIGLLFLVLGLVGLLIL